jgi:hypothetical protein
VRLGSRISLVMVRHRSAFIARPTSKRGVAESIGWARCVASPPHGNPLAIDIRPFRKAWLALRCEYEDGKKLASWIVVPSGGGTRYVNNSVTHLQTIAAHG